MITVLGFPIRLLQARFKCKFKRLSPAASPKFKQCELYLKCADGGDASLLPQFLGVCVL